MQFISVKKLILISGSLLMLGAAVYAAQWKWHFWQPTPASAVQSNIPMPQPQDGEIEPDPVIPDQSANIIEVQSANLFGQEGVVAKKIEPGDEVPKTQQPLELHGIVFVPRHPEQNVALIAQAGGMANKYRTGEEILPFLPGWKVFSISQNTVQIEHEGTVEMLDLPKMSNGGQGAVTPANPFNALPVDEQNVETTEPPEVIEPPLEELPPPEADSQAEGQVPQNNGQTQPAPGNVQPRGSEPTDAVPAKDLGANEVLDNRLNWVKMIYLTA